MEAWVHKSHKSLGCFGRYFQCVREGFRPSACFVFSKQSHCRDAASGSFVWRSLPGSYRWLLFVGKVIFSDIEAGWLAETNLCQSGQGSKLCSCTASSFTSSPAPPPHPFSPPPCDTLPQTLFRSSCPCVCLPVPLTFAPYQMSRWRRWKRGASQRTTSLILICLRKSAIQARREPLALKSAAHPPCPQDSCLHTCETCVIRRHIGKG